MSVNEYERNLSKTSLNTAQNNSLDYEKLWTAVGLHESSSHTGHPCGDYKHKVINNCVSIMSWPKKGVRVMRKFTSIEANKAAFKALWIKSYGHGPGGMPTLADARKYSGNDQAQGWYNDVINFYNSQK